MIKYIGSKRVLADRIARLAAALPGAHSVCDAFTGTTRVAQAFKRAGMDVIANDTATYSEQLAICYVETDAAKTDLANLGALVQSLNGLPGREGYFTRTFCQEARYFQPFNGRRIDAIREEIDRLPLSRTERAVALVSLMEAADRVDSTTGLQMAYLKEWAKRSCQPLRLRLPKLQSGVGRAVRADARELVDAGVEADVYYLDPPYNQHSYFGNYHIWETLVRNDEPPSYGVARKRLDVRLNRSPYNSKRRIAEELRYIVLNARAKFLIVSFNNEGYLTANEIRAMLAMRAPVEVIAFDHDRYVGAKIGIHNLQGQKVGRVSHVRNKEFLFIAGEPREVKWAIERATMDSPYEQLPLAM